MEVECLIELLRLVRNTIHNNGVYFPDKIGDNRPVTYRGITYNFIDENKRFTTSSVF